MNTPHHAADERQLHDTPAASRHGRRDLLKFGLAAIGAAAGLNAFAGAADAARKRTVRRPDPIGTLQIPRIGLLVPVYEGTSVTTLNYGGAGHLAGTVLAGQVGNAVLMGHRTSAGGPFRHLDVLAAGDVVSVDSIDFTVVEHLIVPASDGTSIVRWNDSVTPHLTLSTCCGRTGAANSTSYRYIVRAAVV